MGKLVAAVAVFSVAGLMGGLYWFLQWQEENTRQQLTAAAEWLIQRNQRAPITGGWSVHSVLAQQNSVEIRIKVPEDQAAQILEKPEISRRAALRPGCPTPQEAVWSMLPSGAMIMVMAESDNGQPLANAVCAGPT